MRHAWPVLILLAAALGGCSDDLASKFAFGKQPQAPQVEPNLYPAKYRTEIAEFMRTYLNNPTKVKDAFIATPVLRPFGGVPHYVSCVRYNPRDADNKYEGPQTNLAVFLGGRINEFLPGDEQICAGLNYQRYPEIESMVP